MRTEKILAALRRLKVETGSLACMGCGREHDCGVHGCRIMREAAELIEKLTDRCARYAEEIAVLQEREKWVPVEERLRELAEADKDGRLVVLPCKVGDKVWANLDGMRYPRKCVIEFVNIGSHVTTIVFSTVDGLREQYGANPNSFGKTVFLIREEAEKALEAMPNE